MSDVFILRKLFAMVDGKYQEITVSIEVPKFISDENYVSRVSFSLIPKYNTKIKGIDEINAVENSIVYVNSICSESDDPSFFWGDGERFS